MSAADLIGPWDNIELDDRVLVQPEGLRGSVRGLGPSNSVSVRVDGQRDLIRVERERVSVTGRSAMLSASEVEALQDLLDMEIIRGVYGMKA